MNKSKQPQFRELKFDSAEELNTWLDQTTAHIIDLEDWGQDLTTIMVHESGEILQCNLHSEIYAGKFIDMDKLATGNPIYIYDDVLQGYIAYTKLRIQSILNNQS